MHAKQAFNTPAAREQLFITLYKKAFPGVAAYVNKMGGSFDEAKDIFQDALVSYYEKAMNEELKVNSSDVAYVIGTAKHLWIKTYHRESKKTGIDEHMNATLAAADMEAPLANKLMHYLETAGQKCMDLLKAFYYDKLPVEKVTELFGYSGVRSTTVQKYKCLEKVRETVKEKSLSYADFIE